MSVLFLTEYFRPFEIGGAERSTERLGLELVKAGERVTVMTPNYGAPAVEEAHGLRIVRLPFPQSLKPGQLVRRAWSGNPLIQMAHARRIAKDIRVSGHSVVHVQNSGLVLAGALAAWMTRRPLVVTVRDLAYLTAEEQLPGLKVWLDAQWSRRERWMKRRALRRALIIFVSGALQELYVQKGIVIRDRTRVIYNIGPAPYTGPPPPRDAHSVLFVGKLSRGKGLAVLYAAAELVSREVPEVRFELVGDPGVGFEPPPSSIAGMFTLHGRLDAAAVQQMMLTRAVLVSPSVWPEPLSRVLLEAMASRLPIVATATGGTVEALQSGGSALLVPPGDAAALGAALVRILRSRELGERLASAAAARLVSTFSPEAIVPKALSAYREANALPHR